MERTQPINREYRLVRGPADVEIGLIYTYEQDLISRLLPSLRDSVGNHSARLILVDNAATDDVEAYARVFDRHHIVRNETRLPYGANLNRILEASRSPYVLLLNTDMYFEPRAECVAKMVGFMRAHPDCGVAGCRILHADGAHAPSARRFQTARTIAARRLGMGRWMPEALAEYFYATRDMHAAWPCDWLSGCFLMVRREAVEQVGYFDPRFVKYFEDVDFCLRMTRAGWRVMYNGATYCYHLEQRASKRLLSQDAWLHARSYLRWLRKWGFSPEIAPEREPSRRKAA